MLRNKKSIYILIPLNVMIWGFFIYRFYSAYTESDLPQMDPGSKVVSAKVSLNDSVAYKLDLQYKDPFLKDSHSAQKLSVYNTDRTESKFEKAQEPKIIKAAPTIVKQAPDLKYLGLIKNKISGQSTALVSLNGQSRLIRPSEEIEGITFKSFNNDSLVARWGKEKIVVRR